MRARRAPALRWRFSQRSTRRQNFQTALNFARAFVVGFVDKVTIAPAPAGVASFLMLGLAVMRRQR